MIPVYEGDPEYEKARKAEANGDGEKYDMIAYVDSKIPHHYKLNTGKIFVPSDEMELSGGIILRDLLHLKKKVTRMDI